MTGGNVDRPPAAQLAHRLRVIRRELGDSATAVAGRAAGDGWSQSKVSRIENGHQVPTPDEVRALAGALRVGPDVLAELVGLAEEVEEERADLRPVRVALLGGAPRRARRYRLREEQAEHVGTFHPVVVPGLLQSEAYMRSMIASAGRQYSTAEVEAWLSERRLRQAHRSGRRATQLVTEGALCWAPGGAVVMADQCEHVADLIASRPLWTIGVITRYPPPGAPLEYPTGGFDLYDHDEVLIGTTAGNAHVTDAPTIAKHVALLEKLGRMAIYGAEAEKFLRDLAEAYRQGRR